MAVSSGGGPIARHLAADHARLDALLSRALAEPGAVAPEAFESFREGLLRHIAVEEKILFRAAREARGGEPLALFRRLRIDHGAIAALLVPPPTPALAAEILSLLGPHDAAEEGAGGLYDECDALLADRAAALVEAMRAYPRVRTAPHREGPRVVRRAEDALRISAQQLAVRGDG